MIYVLSGGGTSLNYSVVGGTTEPTSPKENMIWVNTETEITSHVFSATEPVSVEVTQLGVYIAADTGVVTTPSASTCYTSYIKCVSGHEYNFKLTDGQTVVIASFSEVPASGVVGTVLYGTGKENGEETLDYTVTATSEMAYLAIWWYSTNSNDSVPTLTITDLNSTNGPVQGMVWFNIGTSCSAPINILKKDNTVMLYPTACQQYVDGAWVAKTAKTYQNGWVDWVLHLIQNGDVTANTGGWSSPPYGTLTVNENGVKLNDPGEYWTHTMHKTAIDLSPFKTLHFTVDQWKQSWKLYVGIEKTYATSGLTGAGSRLANLQITAAGDYSIDVSSINVSGYVTIIIGGDNSYMRVSAMRLE